MLKDMSSLNQFLVEDLTEEEKLDLFSEEYVQKISMELHKERLGRNLTQTGFAKLLGVSQPMISKLESLEYNPTVKKLAEICYKLGIKLTIMIEKKDLSHAISSEIEKYFTSEMSCDSNEIEQEILQGTKLNKQDVEKISSKMKDNDMHENVIGDKDILKNKEQLALAA